MLLLIAITQCDLEEGMKQFLLKRKFQFILYFIACFFPVVSQLLQVWVTSLFFEAIERKEEAFAITVILISIGYLVVYFILYVASRLMRISYMRNVMLDLRILAFSKIINTSYKKFSQKSKEVYISNLVNDINNFENNFFLNFLNVIYQMGLYIASAIILATRDLLLVAILIAISIINYLISNRFKKKTVKLQQDVSTVNEEFTVDTANTLNGLEIIKLNNIEEKFEDKSIKAIDRLEKTKFTFNFFTDSQYSISNLIGMLIITGVLIYMFTLPRFSYGDIAFIMMLTGNLAFALQNIFPRLNVINSSAQLFHKITSQEEDEVSVLKNNEFIFNHKITVENLSFSYQGKEIFADANFEIEKGKKYLIKGPSGIGKSTLIKLLSMTYDNYQGKILIDGVDLKTINEKSLSENIAFIYQDVFLFEDTIKNNISLYKDYRETEIIAALEKAGLKEFLSKQEQGLSSLILENGKNLSGGERQRISIARAIIKDAEILFIDEATSALDEKLGSEIENSFLNLDSTVIAISHRYYQGISEKYDYVLEIKNKKIETYKAEDYFQSEVSYA